MAHVNTLFAQTLSLIPGHIFQKLEKRYACGRKSRKFGFREQFTFMAFVQLAACASLRHAIRCLQSWQIELFFKEIKQNLKVIRFIGHSENAVKIQLYTALIVYLLLAWLNFKSRLGSSIQSLSQLICLSLIRPMSIEELIKPPVKAEPPSYNLSLLALAS